MTLGEYKVKVGEIRVLINNLADEMGSTYSTHHIYLIKIINDAVNGNLEPGGLEDTFGVGEPKGVLGNNEKCFEWIGEENGIRI